MKKIIISAWCVLMLLASVVNAQNISQFQYYYDTEPGLGIAGNGGFITVTVPSDSVRINAGIPTAGLIEGFHTLYVRAQYDNGLWGLWRSYPFTITPPPTITNHTVTNAEYFYDTDMGVATSIQLPIGVTPADSVRFQSSIPTTGLSEGFHTLYLRVKDSQNHWGLWRSYPFTITPPPTITNHTVTNAEYFYDADMGVATSIQLPIGVTPADSVRFQSSIPTTGLSVGFHTLYVRVKDSQNHWGLWRSYPFAITPPPSQGSLIVDGEAYYDTEPGIGNGIPLWQPIVPADSVNFSRQVFAPNTLANGTHYLYFRLKDSNGNWSLSERAPFTVSGSTCNPVAVIAASGSTSVCAGSSVPLTENNMGAFTFQWQKNGVNIGTNSRFYTATTTGSYTCIITNGTCSQASNAINVFVGDTTPPVISVCAADISATADAGSCSKTNVSIGTTNATDNCSSATITNDHPSTSFPVGITNVTWTATDASNNSSTCIQQVTITDNQQPIPDVASLPDVNGECSASVSTPTATDNCEGTITGTTLDATSYSSQGTYTITWTYDDGNGNTSTQTQTVIVDDVTAPIADVTVLATATGECSASVSAPTATDNCEGTITGTTLDATSYSAQGTYTVTWTYNDGNGNTSTQTQTVIVDDVTDPVTPTLADVTGECSATASTATTTDACVGTVTGTTTDPLTYGTQGSYIIHWTFNDGNGNSTTANQNVIVDDVTDPETPTLADVTGECSATASTATTTDACVGTINGTTPDALTYNTQGSYVIHWTFNDGNGNSTTANQNVIVDDVTNPVTPTLADVTGECSATAATATTTDACVGTVTGTTTDPLTYGTQGSYIIHWTFNDGNGNSTTANQNVIVDDITDPVTPTLSDVTGECSATASTATTTDACVGTVTGTTSDPLTYGSQGSYVIHWTFNDGNGNSTTANQNIIVDDVTNPVTPTLADVTGECSATATMAATTDACVGTVTGTTTDPLTYNTQGSYVIHWTFNDGNGNSTTANQNVIVDDVTDPVTPTLANVTGECSATAATATTTDACVGTVTGTTSDPLTYSTQGSYVIHWTFNDGNGNSTTANQNVIVDDITNPIANVATLSNLTGQCSVTASAPTATDNCVGTIPGTTTDPLTYNSEGTYLIHWTYNDGNGNTTNQTQTVIIQDLSNPVIVGCPANIITNPIAGSCTKAVTWTAPTATDNCALQSLTSNYSSGSVFPIGTTTVIYTATDIHGKISTCTFTVLVNPNVEICGNSIDDDCDGLIDEGCGSGCTLTVNAGQDESTFYGYSGDQTVTRTATRTGGTAPFSWSWTINRPLKCNQVNSAGDEVFSGGTCLGNTCPTSGNATVIASCSGSATVTVKLMDTTNVCVTITDANGCTATDCFKVMAEDVRCFAGNSNNYKIKVCHHTSSLTNPWVQICVADNAVAAHIANNSGDFVGMCSAREAFMEEDLSEWYFDLFPNPAHESVNVSFMYNKQSNYEIQVSDITGRLVKKFSGTSQFGENEKELNLESFVKGVYKLVVIIDGQQAMKKLVVQ